MVLQLLRTITAALPVRSGRIEDDRGAVAAEYGLLLMLIALVIIVAVTAFGFAVADLFQRGADGIP
jgi:pilus assembly protein Flp/PilA